ncbi:MAG TPA: VOC family protein [Ilumatobacteraceae bacterium]|nr:VOC family protein [Ilumatobacteraceae bacterium]
MTSPHEPLGLGPPVQIAYAVPDAAAAAHEWARDTGAGPFVVRPHIELADVFVRGLPGSFDHTSAYGQWGPVMVELVQDHGDGPSPVREMFARGESGLHHLAFFVDDLQSTVVRLVEAGLSVAMSARTSGGVEFCFVDAVATHGHMLELYRPDDRLRAFYARVADAASGWDGRDPVRVI